MLSVVSLFDSFGIKSYCIDMVGFLMNLYF